MVTHFAIGLPRSGLLVLKAPALARLGLPMSSKKHEKILDDAMNDDDGQFAKPQIIDFAKRSTVKCKGASPAVLASRAEITSS